MTLTSYRYSNPLVDNTDQVSNYTVEPDGFNDYVGQFGLHIEAVPEASTVLLVGLGLIGLLGARRRRGKRSSYTARI